jgi:hypothetical protein
MRRPTVGVAVCLAAAVSLLGQTGSEEPRHGVAITDIWWSGHPHLVRVTADACFSLHVTKALVDDELVLTATARGSGPCRTSTLLELKRVEQARLLVDPVSQRQFYLGHF